MQNSTIKKRLLSAGGLPFLLAVLALFPASAFSEAVTLPITIDFPMLRSLVIQKAYTGPDQTAVLVDENNGCVNITISDPVFIPYDSLVLFETRIRLQIGTVIFGGCRQPVKWEGYLHLVQRPEINDQWVLSFDTVDSEIYDRDRSPARIAGMVWGVFEIRCLWLFKQYQDQSCPAGVGAKIIYQNNFSTGAADLR